MRCRACDAALTDTESARKDSSGEYLDLCGRCLPHYKRALMADLSHGGSWPTEEQGKQTGDWGHSWGASASEWDGLEVEDFDI